MRLYDLVLILKASLSEAQRKKLLDTVKEWFKPASPQGGQGKIAKEESWGQKVLSYKIKKEDSGFYVLLTIESEVGVPSDFEKKILQNENVLRHLLIRKK